jgi:hypothetical protein
MASGWYYGHWDYWKLYHKVTFDGINKIIYVNPGETNIDVQVDLYSSWKEWLQLEDYMKFIKAFDTVGGEPTINNEFLDATYFFINGWRLKPAPGSYTLNVNGNLYDVAGDDYVLQADKLENVDNNIVINTNTSVIVRRIESEVTRSVFQGDEIVSASLFGTQKLALEKIPGIEGAVFDISGSVVEIRNILRNPVTASLTQEYTLQLQNMQHNHNN